LSYNDSGRDLNGILLCNSVLPFGAEKITNEVMADMPCGLPLLHLTNFPVAPASQLF
jgi:hypothetical protein